MEIIRLTYPFARPLRSERQVLAIGYFDGVHTGHQEVLQRAVTLAKREGILASVMTFDPHPREVLSTVKHPYYITPLQEKLQQFADLGLDRCYVLTFNSALSQLPPEQFTEEILIALQVDTAVVGFNFTYGHLGRGNVESLREQGGSRMKVQVIRPFLQDGIKVSSTLIREMLHQGSIARVNELLGKPYTLTGKVVHGLGRGSTIGIPTANIEPDDRFVIPGNGVYAVKVQVDEEWLDGVMNIGVKPTFEDDPEGRTMEVHLLHFNRMIYDQTVRVRFYAFIREEQRFPSVDALIAQIRQDIETAKSIL